MPITTPTKSHRRDVADSIGAKVRAAAAGKGSAPGLVDPAAKPKPIVAPGATFTEADVEAAVQVAVVEKRLADRLAKP